MSVFLFLVPLPVFPGASLSWSSDDFEPGFVQLLNPSSGQCSQCGLGDPYGLSRRRNIFNLVQQKIAIPD